MQNSPDYTSFRISTGGLVFRFLTTFHLQDPESYSTRRRTILLVILTWLPLLLLTIYEGNLLNSSLDMPFIYDLKPYVRFLIVIPLLIMAEVVIDPLIASNLQSIDSSGILGDDNREKYQDAIDKLTLRKDSVLADIVILLISVFIVVVLLANLEDLDVVSDFTNWLIVPGNTEITLTYAGWWLLLISSPLLQIVLFRWFWRFYLWAQFLYNVSRINLVLQPTHPDLVGGLGILKNSEGAFILIFFAVGAMFSVSLAEEILYSDATLSGSLSAIVGFIFTAIVIMTLPLFFFTKQLATAKRWGRIVYGGLGYRLSRAFDKKWGDLSDQSSGKELIKTADASAVCDYADIYDNVRAMRFIPLNIKDFITQAIILVLPFVPLVLTEITLKEVLSQILGTLV